MHELFEILAYRARVTGDRPAVEDGTTQLAYSPLARRVAGAAEDIRAIMTVPPVIGLLGGNHLDWIIFLLAGWHAGKTVVPLPPFFRDAQLRQIMADAGITHVLATRDAVGAAAALGVPFSSLRDHEAALTVPLGGAAGQIIYTSGSTGTPKGVLLGGGQLMWSAQALARAINAGADDRYLSAMPLALLLETICAVMIPILVGGPARLEPAVAARFDQAVGPALAAAVTAHRPSCMVLVPHLLAQWAAQLQATGMRAPDSLRFVAVGGAPLPPRSARAAWDLGIPVHEGYGLSECSSVVALNRPGERVAGTVGRPLPGLDVRIEAGEIVVRGPSVMERYLHGAPSAGICRTGDTGAIDAEGRLTILGRLDNVLVTQIGRNISPEWIEALITADPHIAHCVVTQLDGPYLTAVLVPSQRGEAWFGQASPGAIAALVALCCADAPDYATPRDFRIIAFAELARAGLLTGNGRIRRKALFQHDLFRLAPGDEAGRTPS